MDRSELAIIIPAWNEEATISKVIKSLANTGTPIVVNDCSIDSTEKNASNAGAIVLSHNKNKGYDEALNTGFKYAFEKGFKYAITIDADGQHDPFFVENYIDHLENNYDLVIGIRPKKARLAERIFALYTWIRFGIKDPLCGMKGYSMELYKNRGWFDSYSSIGTELALWASMRGLNVKQIEIPVSKRTDNPRFGRLWLANKKIFQALFRTILYLKK